jgi:hypothetical protein
MTRKKKKRKKRKKESNWSFAFGRLYLKRDLRGNSDLNDTFY